MCWVCSPLVKNALANDHWADVLGIEVVHFEALAEGKTSDELGFDGVGDKAGDDTPEPLLVTIDNVPGDTSSTATIEVNGEHVISTIDTVGDQDFFKIELEAGKTYEIGQYAYIGGPSGVPLSDAYIEIYNSTGKLIVEADGGGPNTPSGLDALLSFTPEASGTYYINARSYDNAPENGTTGDEVGDYELFVDLAEEGAYVYKPYYDVDSPLYALDWGSQVDGSSRNPDGEEGPRETGNDFTGHAYNPYGIEGKNVITYYFAKQGDVFISENPADPGLENMVAAGFRDWEKRAFDLALAEFEKVADVVFVEVDNRNEADFKFVTYDGTPNFGVLGRMSPPDEQNEGQAEFNRNGPGWNEQMLVPGGFSFVTLIHEVGHGMGMSHPHDGGGRSGVMRGVESDGGAFSYTTGDFGLNQGVYTMMSYQDGWQDSPYGNASTRSGYGFNLGLAGFDIAVIQDKYGVNEEFATGNDVYGLRDSNAAGTGFQAIWDAGGTDLIFYGGARNSKINLNDATLKYEEGGGGFVSYAHGIFGGFTIANSVTIENARSGAGSDVLTGNEAGNMLHGGGRGDVLFGEAGDDSLYGQDGLDLLIGGVGGDTLFGGIGTDTLGGQDGDDVLYGQDGFDKVNGGFGNDRLFGQVGNDHLIGAFGDDVLIGGAHADRLEGGAGKDLFRFDDGDAGGDRIVDFEAGEKIDFSQIDADGGTEGDQGFTFIGKGAFTGTAGELRYFQNQAGDAVILGDTNGDKLTDLVLTVEGKTELLATDFVL